MDRIEKSIELKASPAKVWRALTDHEEFGQWFRVKLAGPFVVGKSVKGKLLIPGYEQLQWEAWVEAMDVEKRFAFRWHPYAIDPKKDYSTEPTTLVEFFLEKAGAKTTLRVVESGFEKIPAGRRPEAFRMNTGGWEEQIENIGAHVRAAA